MCVLPIVIIIVIDCVPTYNARPSIESESRLKDVIGPTFLMKAFLLSKFSSERSKSLYKL